MPLGHVLHLMLVLLKWPQQLPHPLLVEAVDLLDQFSLGLIDQYGVLLDVIGDVKL